MGQDLFEYYRFPINLAGSIVFEHHEAESGFFRFGSAAICYGQCKGVPTAKTVCEKLYDASKDVRLENSKVCLPFDPSQIIDNLRMERYATPLSSDQKSAVYNRWVRKAYYGIRELLPVTVRRHLQRLYLRAWRELRFPHWPVDFTVDTLHEDLLRLAMKAKGVRRIPFIWFWPRGAKNCLIMTHDVETATGRDFVPQLMDLDDSYGIKASFQFVPEARYELSDDSVAEVRRRGFEVNIHDLNHDGALYQERGEFLRRAAKINQHIRKREARGFRAGAMYRNLEWYSAFQFSYDMSVPNVAHLEPQRGGCCTVMPYFVGRIVELPLTMIQDYSLFHILYNYSIDLWKKQLSIIQQKYGLASFIIHPDYVIERRARDVVETLLDYLRELISQGTVWMALPAEVDRWWRARSQMELVPQGDGWAIEGPEKDRARLAWATLDGDRLVYETT